MDILRRLGYLLASIVILLLMIVVFVTVSTLASLMWLAGIVSAVIIFMAYLLKEFLTYTSESRNK